MSPEARIILNGKLFDDQEFAAALARARDDHPDVNCVVAPAYEAADVPRLTREACDLGVDVVLAAGGDGTLHAVLQGVMEYGSDADQRPELAVLPLGTANDFARSLGILDLSHAFDVALSRPGPKIDVGRVGQDMFINLATGGFGPDVTASTPEPLKRSLGGFAYMVAAVTNAPKGAARPMRFSGDDFEWEGRAYAFAVGNSRFAGGGHQVCPDALIDDGMLDLAILPEVDEGRWLEALRLSVDFGWHGLEAHVVRERAASFRVELDADIHVNLDGEPMAGSTFEFEVETRSLRFRMPPDSPILHTFSQEET